MILSLSGITMKYLGIKVLYKNEVFVDFIKRNLFEFLNYVHSVKLVFDLGYKILIEKANENVLSQHHAHNAADICY